MLAKEFDYGLKKYRPIFLVTIVLILLFYRGVSDRQPTEGGGVTIGYAGPVSTAAVPGVTWIPMAKVTAPSVFDGKIWVDAFVTADGQGIDVFVNPGTLKETDVYMAVDSLRYDHDYQLQAVSSGAAATSETATMRRMAIGFILTFLCLYLPFFSWKLEKDTFWQQVQSPAENRAMLTAKSVVVGFVILVAWVFFWFLFLPGVQELVLLVMASLVVMGLGMVLGIWRRRRWAHGLLYLLLLVLLFLPSAEGTLALLPDSPYLLAAGLALGMVGAGALALWSLRARIAGERAE